MCDKAVSDADLLPKGIQPGRRLTDMELPESRKAEIAQCVFDAVDASRAIASIGLSLDLVSRSCPVNRITRFTEKLSTASCAVDVSILLTAFTKLTFYLALAVNHCSPYKERDAVCLAGVSAIAAGLSTTSAGGAATWATCEVGNKNKLIKELAAKNAAEAETAEAEVQRAILQAAPFTVVRRLHSEENSSAGGEVRRLEETFLRLGCNLSDDQADWLQEGPEILELRSFADDVVRLCFDAEKRGKTYSTRSGWAVEVRYGRVLVILWVGTQLRFGRQMQTFRPVQPPAETDTLKLELSELSEAGLADVGSSVH